MSGLDERDHAAVLTALIDAAMGPDPDTTKSRVFTYGKVPGADGNPGTLPRIYALISIERRFTPANKAVAMTTRSGWRVSVRYVGKTVLEAQWANAKIAAALDQQYITVNGLTSTPLIHESTSAVAPDDGLYSGLVGFTYAL
jgi:hypothetical protein